MSVRLTISKYKIHENGLRKRHPSGRQSIDLTHRSIEFRAVSFLFEPDFADEFIVLSCLVLCFAISALWYAILTHAGKHQ